MRQGNRTSFVQMSKNTVYVLIEEILHINDIMNVSSIVYEPRMCTWCIYAG